MQGADDLLAEILEHIIREKKKEEISDGDKESALVEKVTSNETQPRPVMPAGGCSGIGGVALTRKKV